MPSDTQDPCSLRGTSYTSWTSNPERTNSISGSLPPAVGVCVALRPETMTPAAAISSAMRVNRFISALQSYAPAPLLSRAAWELLLRESNTLARRHTRCQPNRPLFHLAKRSAGPPHGDPIPPRCPPPRKPAAPDGPRTTRAAPAPASTPDKRLPTRARSSRRRALRRRPTRCHRIPLQSWSPQTLPPAGLHASAPWSRAPGCPAAAPRRPGTRPSVRPADHDRQFGTLQAPRPRVRARQ